MPRFDDEDINFFGAAFGGGGTSFTSPGFEKYKDYEKIYEQCWLAEASGINYNIDDKLSQNIFRDFTSKAPVLTELWVNATEGTLIWETGDVATNYPILSNLGPCEVEEENVECKKWGSLITSIENSVRTNETYTIELTFADGSKETFDQPTFTSRIDLSNHWQTEIQLLLPDSNVEVRCNRDGGCSPGLEPPPDGVTLDRSFRWRYISIESCNNDTKVPVAAQVIASSRSQDIGRFMPIQFNQLPEQRGYISYSIGGAPILYYENGTQVPLSATPFCLLDCAEGFPGLPQPLVECSTFYTQLCDDVNGDGSVIVNFWREASVCILEDRTVSFDLEDYTTNPLITDPDSLAFYTIQGVISPCGTEISSKILCDECGRLIEVVGYDDGETLYYEYDPSSGRGDLTYPAGKLTKCVVPEVQVLNECIGISACSAIPVFIENQVEVSIEQTVCQGVSACDTFPVSAIGMIDEFDETQTILASSTAILNSIDEKLNEPCSGSPLNVNVCDPVSVSIIETICQGVSACDTFPVQIVGPDCIGVSSCDVGVERTPTRLSTTTDGTVAAGNCGVAIHNHDSAITAQVLGVDLPPGETVTFSVDPPDTLGAITYVTNGAELHINTLG